MQREGLRATTTIKAIKGRLFANSRSRGYKEGLCCSGDSSMEWRGDQHTEEGVEEAESSPGTPYLNFARQKDFGVTSFDLVS